MKHVLTVLAVLAASLAAGVPMAGTAMAAERRYVKWPPNYGSFEGKWVEACDMERDGHGVYIEGSLFDGRTFNVPDPNGADGGCGNDTFGSNVYSMRVCERGSGCSWWKDWNGHEHRN